MKLNSIQFLRAIAALLVVYEHSMDTQIRFGTSWQQKFYHLDNFGCIGVDLFFVISGFIITYVANKYNGIEDGIHFLEKRFYRINPIYYIATLLCFVVYIIQLQLSNIPLSRVLNKTLSSFIDSIVIIPTSEDTLSFKPLLIIGWTLSFEWLFYILFFILISCTAKRKPLYLSTLILVLIGVGVLMSPKDLRMQFITNPIMLEFVLGIFICHIYIKDIKIPTWLAISSLTIGLISYFLLVRYGYGNVWYYLDTITGKTSLNKFLLWGIPSSCIVAGLIFVEKNGYLKRLFNNKYALLLGNASYSIYLIHYLILNLLGILYTQANFFWPSDLMIWLQLIVATASGIFFYRLIEKPLLKRLKIKNQQTFINEKTTVPIPETIP